MHKIIFETLYKSSDFYPLFYELLSAQDVPRYLVPTGFFAGISHAGIIDLGRCLDNASKWRKNVLLLFSN